jgi:hypothetical protein
MASFVALSISMQPFRRCPYSLASIFVVPLFSFFLMCTYTSVTDYSDTARSLSKEAPPSQQRILPVSTPDCLRASGSPTLCNTITPATVTPVHPITHHFIPRTVYDDVLVPPFLSILPSLIHETCRRLRATRPLHLQLAALAFDYHPIHIRYSSTYRHNEAYCLLP